MKLLKLIVVIFFIYFIRRFYQMYQVMKTIRDEQLSNKENQDFTKQSKPKDSSVIDADFKVMD